MEEDYAQQKHIDSLLIERYSKRGIVVEVSYPESKSYAIFQELQKKIKEQDSEINKHFLFIDLFSLEETRELNDRCRGGNHKEQAFFKKLQDLWGIQEKILDAVRRGITVVVSHYVFDLILAAYSENMFDCRECTDRVAYSNLLMFLKKLVVPDLVLSFPGYPKDIERLFLESCEGKLKSENNKEMVVYSKIFQKEVARDTLGAFFESLRPVESDLVSLHINCFGAILSQRCQKEFTRIKFY